MWKFPQIFKNKIKFQYNFILLEKLVQIFSFFFFQFFDVVVKVVVISSLRWF
jgi:hypothetical protein